MKSGSLSNTASLQNAVACEADYVEHLNALFTVLDKGASGSVISSEDIEVFRGHINDLVSWSKPPRAVHQRPCSRFHHRSRYFAAQHFKPFFQSENLYSLGEEMRGDRFSC
eukprot:RCo019054